MNVEDEIGLGAIQVGDGSKCSKRARRDKGSSSGPARTGQKNHLRGCAGLADGVDGHLNCFGPSGDTWDFDLSVYGTISKSNDLLS